MCTISFLDLIKHVGVTEDQLEQKCTKDHLVTISKEIENWLDYVCHLGLSDQETNAIRTDTMLSYAAQSRKVLEVWHNKNGFTATYGRLVKIFLDGGNANIAESVCRIVEAETPQTPSTPASLFSLSSISSTVSLASPKLDTPESPLVHESAGLLDKETRENFEGRLQDEAQKMDMNFCTEVSRIRKSLKSRQVNPSGIGNHLSVIKAVTKQVNDGDASVPVLFHLNRKELINVETIDKLFQFITPYISFFNYDIIEQVVEEYGSAQDKESFQAYLEKFEQFCKRRATQVPTNLDGEDPSTTRFKVKVEEDFEQVFTVKAVRSFRSKLCKILGVTEPCLRLLSIEEGCILLTFILPTFILCHVFPLTKEQEEAMIGLGSLQYAIGDSPAIKLQAPVRERLLLNLTENKPKATKIPLSNASTICFQGDCHVIPSRETQGSARTTRIPKQPRGLLARSPIATPDPPVIRSSTTPPPSFHLHSPGFQTPPEAYRRMSVPAQLSTARGQSHPFSTMTPTSSRGSVSPSDKSAFIRASHSPPEPKPVVPRRRSVSPTPAFAAVFDQSYARSPPPSIPTFDRPSNLPMAVSSNRRSISPVPDNSALAQASSSITSAQHFSQSMPVFPVSKSPPPGASHHPCARSPSLTDPLTSPHHQSVHSSFQFSMLLDMYKQTKEVIGVFYRFRDHQEVAGEIHKVMSGVLTRSRNIVCIFEMKPEGPDWLTTAASQGVTRYVFLSYPPVRSLDNSCEEAKFFNHHEKNGKRVTEVLFLKNIPTTPTKVLLGKQWSAPWQKQLKRFLHLDGTLSTMSLVERILAHFIAPPPTPDSTDCVYWSAVPKLFRVKLKKQKLGLTLVTREMSSTSAFPRITLVKVLSNDCMEELRQNVGKNTHIQSINGRFLDGLGLKETTSIIQTECTQKQIQLMVRYIHKTEQIAGSKLDPSQENLPIPVYILADNYRRSAQLFSCLSNALACASTPSPSPSSPPHLIQAKNTTLPLADSKIEDSPGPDVRVCDSSSPPSTISSLSASTKKLTVLESTGSPKEKVEDQTSQCVDESSETVQSDQWTVRTDVSLHPYKFHPFVCSPTTPVNTLQPKRQLTAFQQLQIADKRYILQMFKEGFDRRLAHLYLRSSGLFLVTAWLEELADDPLIQYENLSHWLCLVQTHVSQSDGKRVIIVGMFDGRDYAQLVRLQEYVTRLNSALLESDLHNHVFDQNRTRRLTAQKKQHRLVHMFDVSHPLISSQNLLAKVSECTGLLVMKAFYYDKQFFKSTFEAFDGLTIALREVSSLPGVVASSKNLQSIISRKPSYALETLASYSTALVGISKGDALLKPSFLVDLVLDLGAATQDPDIYDVFTVSAKHLKDLPVVSTPLILHVMETVCVDKYESLLSQDSKHAILEWAERLGLVFPIGKGAKGEVNHLVPLIATDLLGDKAKFSWDSKDEEAYKSPKVNVLYVYLNFPAIHQFFYRVLAELLKDGFSKSMSLYKYLINFGCNEAILPLSCSGSAGVHSVMVVYHYLQNVIEFRIRHKEQQGIVECGVLEAVKSKLKSAFQASKHKEQQGIVECGVLEAVKSKLKSAFQASKYAQSHTFDSAVTFHVPSAVYDDKLLTSSLWKLWEFELSQRGTDTNVDTEPTNMLLKTKELSSQSANWTVTTNQQPDMKEIPADLYIKWGKKLSSSQDHWAMVGSKLKLLSTADIQFLRTNPAKAGNGEEVLRRWTESLLSYKDLIDVLRSPAVQFNTLASEIEQYFTGSDL